MSLSEAIRRDRRWEGPRLALAFAAALIALGALAVTAALGPPPLTKALGALGAALLAYGAIRYNREGVATFLSMFGLSGEGWFAGLGRATWIVSGLIMVGKSIELAIEAGEAL